MPTEHDGATDGVEVALSPLGAHMLIGVPMDELASRAVALEDVVAEGPLLAERLHGAGDWPARFDLLDRWLAARLDAAPSPKPDIAWAWRTLVRTSGRAHVGAIGSELGWSRRRLVAAFREHVGLAPKTAARLLRFARAARLVREARPWADVAYECGYFDQAHFNRDFRAFAGLTPTDFVGRLSPEDPGVAA